MIVYMLKCYFFNFITIYNTIKNVYSDDILIVFGKLFEFYFPTIKYKDVQTNK